ncbi:MAG: hypothetical protein IID41_12165, partial [Planctomycetes bacterium]|nr:hypothetical protein [Planctomycetota bacterium]
MTIVLQIVLSLAAQEMVRYDKLTLLDGSVITGQVEREDDRAIMIRVIKDQGSVNYLRRVFKKDLAYREFVDLPQSRSPVDGELGPFRIFVPEGYDPDQAYPFVIALHGAGGDENSFMDRYQGLYKKNAQDRGYIVASVNGRGPYGGYRGDSGQDVIDVLDMIEATYRIDKDRRYIMVHSMGGGGTVLVGFD